MNTLTAQSPRPGIHAILQCLAVLILLPISQAAAQTPPTPSAFNSPGANNLKSDANNAIGTAAADKFLSIRGTVISSDLARLDTFITSKTGIGLSLSTNLPAFTSKLLNLPVDDMSTAAGEGFGGAGFSKGALKTTIGIGAAKVGEAAAIRAGTYVVAGKLAIPILAAWAAKEYFDSCYDRYQEAIKPANHRAWEANVREIERKADKLLAKGVIDQKTRDTIVEKRKRACEGLKQIEQTRMDGIKEQSNILSDVARSRKEIADLKAQIKFLENLKAGGGDSDDALAQTRAKLKTSLEAFNSKVKGYNKRLAEIEAMDKKLPDMTKEAKESFAGIRKDEITDPGKAQIEVMTSRQELDKQRAAIDNSIEQETSELMKSKRNKSSEEAEAKAIQTELDALYDQRERLRDEKIVAGGFYGAGTSRWPIKKEKELLAIEKKMQQLVTKKGDIGQSSDDDYSITRQTVLAKYKGQLDAIQKKYSLLNDREAELKTIGLWQDIAPGTLSKFQDKFGLTPNTAVAKPASTPPATAKTIKTAPAPTPQTATKSPPASSEKSKAPPSTAQLQFMEDSPPSAPSGKPAVNPSTQIMAEQSRKTAQQVAQTAGREAARAAAQQAAQSVRTVVKPPTPTPPCVRPATPPPPPPPPPRCTTPCR